MSDKRSYWLKSGLLTIGERLSLILFGFGSLYLLLRALSKDEFGVWVLFLTVTSFIEVGRVGLLQNALVKYLTTIEEEDDYRRISTASLILNIILSFGCVILLLAIAYPLSRLWEASVLSQLIQIYCLTTVVLIPFIQSNFTQQANLDFKGIFWGNFSRQGAFFLYILVFYVNGWAIELVGLAWFQIVAAAIGVVGTLIFGTKYLRFSRFIDFEWVKTLFNFGKYVFGTNVSTMLYKSIDKMMLGSMLSPVAVALYELAIRITNLAEVPTFSIASIVFPQSARRLETHGPEGIKFLYEKSVGAILAFILPFIFIVLLFPGWIIQVIASDKYLDAVPVLQLTMIYGFFVPFGVQFGTVLDSTGKPKINFYFTILGTVLNLIFNYIFISSFGLIGAAYGTLITYMITFGIMQMILYRELNVKFYYAFYYAVGFYIEAFKYVQRYLTRSKDLDFEPPQHTTFSGTTENNHSN